ncbi:MAG TPA: chemotaxis protein CheA [Betaproteobacteria bacterium]|nr:chemotaxis protein CheA [Betaproteobacteria bacterium]
MTVDMSQFYQVFFEEAGEHLSNMENLLLSLDIESPEQEDLNAIFRAAHSIKGGSATFGFTDIAEVTHILESLLDRIRNGELALQKDMVDVFLRAGDILKDQLAAHQNDEESDAEAARGVCEELTRWQHSDESAAPAKVAQPPESTPPADTATAPEQRYTITFTPSSSPTEHGVHMENMAAELGKLGSVDILAEGSAEHPVWRFALTTAAPEEAIRELFDFFAQPTDVVIESAAPAPDEEEQGYGFFTDIAPPEEETEQGYGFFTDVDAVRKTAEEEAQGYGFFEKIEPPKETAPAAASGGGAGRREAGPKGDAASPGKRGGDKAAPAAQTESIRVSVEKVDQLINLVGELVITQAMVAQTASKLPPDVHETLQVSLSQLEHNTRDLQESVMSIRMMPISFVFSRFPRVVRDLSSKLNKQVELKTVGEGTELDKGLIEKLSDPLTHLVRNSLDHGVESPEKRLAAGKPAKGTITLRASHQGGNVVIEVIDDGAGMDREKILAKAKERGIPVSDTMPDQEVWQLIFEAGFSTAEVVTDVSGRGVGMDVVKKNIIHGMGGRIEMESHNGAGTRIIIRLPLTLAILDGMSVSVGGDIFITPLTYIVESLKPRAEDIKTVSGRGRVVYVRGEYVTLLSLHDVFNIKPVVTEPQDGILVLVEAEGKKVALFVDELVGQHQVVIKSLETNFRKVAGISGATIMGDGKVALILDISSLVRLSQG